MRRALLAAIAVLVVLVVGCGPASTAPGKTQPPATPVSAAPDAVDRVIEVRVRGDSVDGVPERVEVALGSRVRIEVTSDRADELHVHGFDVAAPVSAGGTAAVTFVADAPGVFTVELHDLGRPLFRLQVS